MKYYIKYLVMKILYIYFENCKIVIHMSYNI